MRKHSLVQGWLDDVGPLVGFVISTAVILLMSLASPAPLAAGNDFLVTTLQPDGTSITWNCGRMPRPSQIGCDDLLIGDSALFVGSLLTGPGQPGILHARVLFRCALPPGTRNEQGKASGQCQAFRPEPQDYPPYENTVRTWGIVREVITDVPEEDE